MNDLMVTIGMTTYFIIQILTNPLLQRYICPHERTSKSINENSRPRGNLCEETILHDSDTWTDKISHYFIIAIIYLQKLYEVKMQVIDISCTPKEDLNAYWRNWNRVGDGKSLH